jgi:hypothetical protein
MLNVTPVKLKNKEAKKNKDMVIEPIGIQMAKKHQSKIAAAAVNTEQLHHHHHHHHERVCLLTRSRSQHSILPSEKIAYP